MKRSRWLGLGILGLLGVGISRWSRFALGGRNVLVTGGSRGLGLAIARELVRRRARVILCARDEGELESARADLESRGGEVRTFVCDVSRPAQVDEMISDAGLCFGGPIDVVVNNAGIIRVGPLESMTRADFEEVMAVNFWGMVNVSLAVLPKMQERRSGRIVNVTSIGGKVAVPHLLPYDCAKFAAVGFSEGLRAEVAKDGVRVSTIVPGLMRTGSALRAEFKGDAEKEFAWFAMGDATSVTAMSARRAARRIVEACERGEAHVTLGWQAKLLALVKALAPGPVTDLLGIVNRLLPRGTHPARHVGRDLVGGRSFVRRLVEKDASELNQ